MCQTKTKLGCITKVDAMNMSLILNHFFEFHEQYINKKNIQKKIPDFKRQNALMND